MTPTEIAAVLVEHELHTVQEVKPYRTLWQCRGCDHEVDATTVRHSVAQSKHQGQKVATAIRRESKTTKGEYR